MCKSSLLWICKWIGISDCSFASVRLSSFDAINSKTFMWKFSSFSGHFPQVDTPLQKVPQPDFDTSACIIKYGSFNRSDLPLFNLKFSTHQRSSYSDRLCDTISAWYQQNWFGDYICCSCKYFSCRRAGRTAWTVEDILPINSGNFRTVVFRVKKEILTFQNFQNCLF